MLEQVWKNTFGNRFPYEVVDGETLKVTIPQGERIRIWDFYSKVRQMSVAIGKVIRITFDVVDGVPVFTLILWEAIPVDLVSAVESLEEEVSTQEEPTEDVPVEEEESKPRRKKKSVSGEPMKE